MTLREYFDALNENERKLFLTKLSRRISKSLRTVRDYAYKSNGKNVTVPAEFCNVIYYLTHKRVKPHEIRPDTFTVGQLPKKLSLTKKK